MPTRSSGRLLVNVGSTYLKIAVVDEGGGVAEIDRRDLRNLALSSTGAGHHAWDGERLVRWIADSVDHAVGRYPQIDAVSLSVHTRGFAIEESGKPVVYVPWHDARSLGSYDKNLSTVDFLRETVDPADRWASGMVLRANMPLANAAHWVLAESGPRAGRFHTLGSFILSRLVGRYMTHETVAAATGFYSVAGGGWLSDVIDTAGCGGLEFPEVMTGLGEVGQMTTASGSVVRVAADIGDSQCAAFGVRLDSRSAVLVSIGTAGLVTVAIDRFNPDDKADCRPFFGKYLRVVSGLAGGRELGAELEQGVTKVMARMLGKYRAALDDLVGFDHRMPVVLSGGVAAAFPQLRGYLADAFARPVLNYGERDRSLLGLQRISDMAPSNAA